MADFLRTGDVAEADRFAQWRHWISSTFVPLECAQVSREPFRGEVASWALGEMLVSRVAADPHLASRTRRMIAMREAGYYKVGLLTRGSCRLTQEGREALLRPGDLAIYDCRRPYTMAFSQPHQMSFLMFPCDRLRLPPAAVDQGPGHPGVQRGEHGIAGRPLPAAAGGQPGAVEEPGQLPAGRQCA
jgi:hypothetical protein